MLRSTRFVTDAGAAEKSDVAVTWIRVDAVVSELLGLTSQLHRLWSSSAVGAAESESKSKSTAREFRIALSDKQRKVPGVSSHTKVKFGDAARVVVFQIGGEWLI